MEGMNNRANFALRQSYGVRSYKSYELTLYHILANFPRHRLAHRVCCRTDFTGPLTLPRGQVVTG